MSRILLLVGALLSLHPASAQDIPVFTDITSSYTQICAIDNNSAVVCNQAPYAQRLIQPDNLPSFSDVTVGQQHACALTLDQGVALCWGDNDFGQLNAPDTVFTAIDAGRFHTCGITAAGVLECWGIDNYGQTTVPADISQNTFTKMRVHQDQSCVLDATNQIQCWGEVGSYTPQLQSAPDLAVIDFAGGFNYLTSTIEQCALREDGTIGCIDPSQHNFGTKQYTDVAYLEGVMCGLTLDNGRLDCVERSDGTVKFFDDFLEQMSEVNAGEPLASIEGGDLLCGITVSGVAKCIAPYIRSLESYPSVPGDNPRLLPAPQNLRADIYSDSVLELFWEPGEALSSNIQRADIFRNGEFLNSTTGLSSYLDNTIERGMAYDYQVRYVALNGTDGLLSGSISVGTAGSGGTPASGIYNPPIRPFEPGNVRALVYSDSVVELQWDRVQSINLGYEIRRDGVYIGYTSGISYVDEQANVGSQPVYEILAVDNDSNILGVTLIQAK